MVIEDKLKKYDQTTCSEFRLITALAFETFVNNEIKLSKVFRNRVFTTS